MSKNDRYFKKVDLKAEAEKRGWITKNGEDWLSFTEKWDKKLKKAFNGYSKRV
jgi:hypothetical protein